MQSRAVEDMRYDTLGDWYYERDALHIDVADSRPGGRLSPDEQFLIALHEFIEAWLCDARGIAQETVDRWDMENSEGPEEPGDNIGCPYRREHRFAMLIEHLMAHELGLINYGKVT
jgi:hypothetical protein